MAGVDWTQFSAGAPAGGGVDWLQHSGTAPIIHAPAVRHVAVKKPSSGGGSWFGNALGQAESFITQAPNAVVGVGKGLANTIRLAQPVHIGAHGGLEWGAGTPAPGSTLGEAGIQFAKSEGQLYSPLVHGEFGTFRDRLKQQPLTPLLDLATIASLGGGAALRAGRLGLLGEKAGELARAERILRDRELTARFPQSRTLQGRLMQRTYDRWTMGEGGLLNADTPLIGGRARLNRRITTQANRTRMARVQRAKLDFYQAQKKATPAERFAATIVAEGVKIPDLLTMYRKLQEDSPTRARARYIKQLEHPATQAAIDEMSPALRHILDTGYSYEKNAGEAAVAANIVDPGVREARAVLPQRLAAGARFEGERTVRVPGEDRFATDRAAMQKDLASAEADYQKALKRVTSLTERVRAHTARIDYAGAEATSGHRMNLSRARNELARARKTMEEAKQSRDFQRESLSSVPGKDGPHSATIPGDFNGPPAERFIGKPNPFGADLPPVFRFPHIGGRGGAGIYSVPLPRLTKVLRPGFTKRNEGVRFTTGRMIRNPDAWLEDWLTGDRFQYSLDWQRNVLDRVRLPASTEPGGFNPRTESIYRPSHGTKTTTRIPRELTEEDIHASELGIQTHDVGRASSRLNRLQRHAEGVVMDHLPADLEKIAREPNGWQKLADQGVYRIPRAYGKAYQHEFKGTSYLERLILDKPTDIWRMLTLKFRPAWTVNNIVGQHVLFAMHHAGPRGAAAYLKALAGSPGGRTKILKIAKLHIPIPVGWERTISKVMDEIAPELHSTGFGHSQVRITHMGSHEPALSSTQAARAARALKVAPKAPWIAVKSFGDANAWVNAHLADNLPRDAAFLANARPILNRIKKQARELEGLNLKTEEALKRLDRPTVEKLVDDTLRQLGDFQSMNHFERTWMRRVIPFYSWFKVITTLTLRYARDYPARIKLLSMIEAVTNEKDAQLPSWLEGAIPLGPAVHGIQPMLSTAGINPFETVVQLAHSAASLVKGKPQFGTSNPGGLLNPFLQDFFGPGLYNKDPFTGGDYQGLGSGQGGAIPRALGAFVQGTPEYRLKETTTGNYKSSLYANTTEDYWLNYFGWPVRKVRLAKARALHQEGR